MYVLKYKISNGIPDESVSKTEVFEDDSTSFYSRYCKLASDGHIVDLKIYHADLVEVFMHEGGIVFPG